eukprot:5109525-Pleurochrysis_carterae.AAC.1
MSAWPTSPNEDRAAPAADPACRCCGTPPTGASSSRTTRGKSTSTSTCRTRSRVRRTHAHACVRLERVRTHARSHAHARPPAHTHAHTPTHARTHPHALAHARARTRTRSHMHALARPRTPTLARARTRPVCANARTQEAVCFNPIPPRQRVKATLPVRTSSPIATYKFNTRANYAMFSSGPHVLHLASTKCTSGLRPIVVNNGTLISQARRRDTKIKLTYIGALP